MQLNQDQLNISPLNYIVSLDGFPGIQWFQCANWAQDANHGGVIGSTRIYDGNQVFGRLSREINESGGVDYIKIFGYHAGELDWSNFNLTITQNASLMFPRANTAIAIGSACDTMADKPNDASFGNSVGPISCPAGDSFALWIRRTITAGTPIHGQFVETIIQMQEV